MTAPVPADRVALAFEDADPRLPSGKALRRVLKDQFLAEKGAPDGRASAG